MSVYRSEAGRREVLATYDRAVQALPVDVRERTVETRHGATHVLLAGAADAPPVVVFHGGNATNPITLAWYAGLADEYRLLAPDTIGQPGKSAETRLDPWGDGYGEWVADLLDAFELSSAPVIGTSYGAGIALRAAAHVPERVERAGLVVPAGFGTGPIRSLLRVGLPAVLYRYVRREWLLDRVLDAMATESPPDPIVRETVAASLRHVSLEREFPGATAEELADFDAPVALVAADDDPFFPVDAIVPRARERLQTLSEVPVLDGERHLCSAAAQQEIRSELRSFLPAR